MRLVILEGPDGAGKTMLANELVKYYGFAKIHQGPFEGDPLLDSLTAVSKGLSEGRDLVCDRLHLGERIYGPILRNKDELGDEKQRMLERALLGIAQTTQILCLPPWENVLKAWTARYVDELVRSQEDLKKIYLMYKSQPSFLPTILYDWTAHDVTWLLNEMTHWIGSPANPGPGIGWWENTSVLVVGEQCNTNKPGPLLPFVGTGGSSLWLAEKLKGVDERKMYWVNAQTPDGKEEDPTFIESLNPAGSVSMTDRAKEQFGVLF